jgi:hypothetical protein
MLLYLCQANFVTPAQTLELKLRLLSNHDESPIQPFNQVRQKESSLPLDGAHGFDIDSNGPFLTGKDDHLFLL